MVSRWLSICRTSEYWVCALIYIVEIWFGIVNILWRSDLGLLMDEFRQFLTELSACDTFVFSFPDDNLSKYQWIFTKLDVCIEIVEIWFGIADGHFSSIFLQSCLLTIHPYFTFRTITWVNLNGFLPHLICAFILWRSAALGLLSGKFIACNMIMVEYCHSIFYFFCNLIKFFFSIKMWLC